MASLLWYGLAAIAEISGCFAFWAWIRLHKSPLWTLPGLLALIVFASALTRIDSPSAGRSYAAYGGIYIVGSVLWLWLIEGVVPDQWDLIGSFIAIVGAMTILFARRP